MKLKNILSAIFMLFAIACLIYASVAIVTAECLSEKQKASAALAIPTGIACLATALAIFIDKDPLYKRNPIDNSMYYPNNSKN